MAEHVYELDVDAGHTWAAEIRSRSGSATGRTTGRDSGQALKTGCCSELLRGHLDLGGRNPRGDQIAVNSRYIEFNGQPFLPVIGEFHYARQPAAFWEESLCKLKAGGINVVASYVFWILHEPKERQARWSGDLDLRHFISLCAKHHLRAIVRLGPFCHGEIRNGGLPDWLYGQPFEVRSNDRRYLAYVERHYNRIARELDGLLFKDGGPVIGVQLENEYQHSAAPWEFGYPGSARELTVVERDQPVTHLQVASSLATNPHAAEGREHMSLLKQIARRNGIDVPIYTATGWGNAAIVEDGCIPVTAGYPYPFWTPPAPSPLYHYRDLHAQPDYLPVSYDPGRYPSLSAELGPGIAVTFSRRPIVPPESVPPMIVRMLGSGSNGIGYYMYHGGSTPADGGDFHEASGGLPRINYDFQAPIGEFGQLRAHFRSLRRVHLFLHSFGDRLAGAHTLLPAAAATPEPTEVDRLRFAVRARDGAGFVFLHNYQDHVALHDLHDVRLRLQHAGGEIRFPRTGSMTVPIGTSAILPLNLDVPGGRLVSATVQPLTILRHETSTTYVYCSVPGLPPEWVFQTSGEVVAGEGARISRSGEIAVIRGDAEAAFRIMLAGVEHLVLPEPLTLDALRTEDQRLFMSGADLWPVDNGVRAVVRNGHAFELQVYPSLPEGGLRAGRANVEALSSVVDGLSSRFRITLPRVEPSVSVEPAGPRRYVLRARNGIEDLHDVRVRIRYRGDRVLAFIGGTLVADHFYQGQPWEIGLRKFIDRLRENDMVLVFHPMHRSYPYFDDLAPEHRPVFAENADEFLAIDGFDILPDHTDVLTW